MKTYTTQGTCSRAIEYEVADGVLTSCRIIGGCPGNTQGAAKLDSDILTGNIRGVFSILVIMFAMVSTAEDNSKPWIVREPNFTCDSECSVRGEVENGTVAEYLAYIPIPVTSQYQEITWTKRPPEKLLKTHKDTGNVYISLEGVNADKIPSFDYSFKVTFFRVRVDFSKIGIIYPYDKTKREYKFYTRKLEERGKDASGRVREWKDLDIPWVRQTSRKLLKEANNNIVSYVRKVYELVSAEFEYYADDAPGVHPGNLLQAIESKRGHCGLRSRVFVTLLRAAKIPARTLNCTRTSGCPHVWAEFYLEKYGWIPIQLSHAAGDFSGFGVYQSNCIVLKTDSCIKVKSKTGRECVVGQSYGRWSWGTRTMKGKARFEWTMDCKNIIKHKMQ